jgi:S1-C subfamily serine protease
MKRLVKIAAIILVLSVIPVGAATYQVTTANYPILVNDQKVNVQPYNLNGSTLLPIRALSDALGVPIEWDNRARTVEIQTVDVDRLKEASVMIFAENTTVGSQGSAVCWDYGEYLTAYHTVDNGQTNVRTSSGEKLTVDRINEGLDIATLDAADNIKPVKIGDSDEVKVGDKVLIISSPQGKQNTVSWTVVEKITNEIVVNSKLGGGASGGAVFNTNGQLIGILIAGDIGLGEGYVTTINDIRKAF